MKNLLILMSILNIATTFASEKNIELQMNENKLVLHVCTLPLVESIKSIFSDDLNQKIQNSKCEVLSYIKVSEALDSLTKNYIYGVEKTYVKYQEGENFNQRVCDGQNDACMDNVYGIDVVNPTFFLFSFKQKNKIIDVISKNSLKKESHLYFFNNQINCTPRGDSSENAVECSMVKAQLLLK